MADSYTRQVIRRERVLEAPNRKAILEASRDLGLKEIRDFWKHSNFFYEKVRPKPSYSKSERAWKGWVEQGPIPALIFTNAATDKYGQPYARYVHFKGDRTLLMVRVEEVIRKRVASTGRALTHDRIKAGRVISEVQGG